MPDLGLLRGVITLVTLGTFIGICWWAYRPENRARFEEDGLLAFDEEELQSTGGITADNTQQGAEEDQA